MSRPNPSENADRCPASSASNAAASADDLSHCAQRLGRIEELLRQPTAGNAANETAALAALAPLASTVTELTSTVAALHELVQRGFEHLAELLAPHAVESAEAAAAGSTLVPGDDATATAVTDARPTDTRPTDTGPTGDRAASGETAGAAAAIARASSGEGLAAWERAILGDALADDEALAFQRRRFVQEVLQGRPAACGLAGSLLALRAAAPERMAQLLKDIGETYYRWQPKRGQGQGQGQESSALEEALAGWLQRRCETAGLSNTIELVHPGQRFDAARHNAASRGVEIVEVQGWVVLREGGKVYTKATVAVR